MTMRLLTGGCQANLNTFWPTCKNAIIFFFPVKVHVFLNILFVKINDYSFVKWSGILKSITKQMTYLLFNRSNKIPGGDLQKKIWSLSFCISHYFIRYLIFLGPCDGNPCQNGGICSVNDEDFDCTCHVGFTGTTCESGSFECVCHVGFTGTTCESGNFECVCHVWDSQIQHVNHIILNVSAMWDLQAQHVNQVILNVLAMCGIYRHNMWIR